MLKTSIRNSLEHFDNRLDKLLLSLHESKKTLIYKMVISSKKAFSSWEDCLPFKVYAIEDDEYHVIAGDLKVITISLGNINNEAAIIDEFLTQEMKKKKDDQGKCSSNPGGIIQTPPHHKIQF